MANKTISIGFKLDDNGQGLKTLTMDATELKKAMDMVVKEATSMRDVFIETGAQSFGFDAIKSGLQDISNLCNELTAAYQVQLEAETKLETVMRERMGATDEMIQGIKDLTSAQQELGVIGDEVQLAGAQQIATFLSSEQALRTLIPAMNDLVAQQKGYNASASDAVNVGNLIGKVMQGQTSALKRVGITFTDAQQKALEFGTEEEKAAMLAEIITSNVGHMNQELANTPIGAVKQLSNNLGDIVEKMGSMISGVMPWITFVNQVVTLQASLGKLRTFVMALSGAFRNLVADARAGAAGVNGVGTSFTFANRCAVGFRVAATMAFTTIKAALISTGIGAAIWALGEALGFLYNQLNKVGDAAEDAAGVMSELEAAQKSEEEALRQQEAQLKLNISRLKEFKGSKEEEQRICQEMNGIYGETLGNYYSVNEWYKTLSENSEKYTRKLILEARARRLANEAASLEDKYNQAQINYDNAVKADQEYEKKTGKKPGAFSTAPIAAQSRDLYKEAAEKKQKELEENIKEQGEIQFTKGKGKGGGGGGNPKQEKPAPAGSIADYENQIKEIEAKIKLQVDPDSIEALMREKMALEEKIGTLKGKLEIELKKEEALKKAKDFLQKNPLELKVNLDTEQLQSEARKMPMVFKKSSVQVNNLEKDLNSVAQVCGKAGQAFSQMGQSFDEPVLNIVGIIAQGIANMVAGFGSAVAKGGAQMNPWEWVAFGIAGLAELTAMIAQVKSISKFANGGIVSGPTMALVGEYPGASNNPEVIAPLNKLRSLIGTPGGAQTVVVGGDIRLRGSDLMIALRNQKAISGASGRRTL